MLSCCTLPLLGSVTPCQEAGQYFSHLVFGILIAALLTDKVREWCTSSTPSEIDRLIQEIERELESVRQSAARDERDERDGSPVSNIIGNVYQDSKKDAEKLNESLIKGTSWLNAIYYILLIGCTVVLAYLISTDQDKNIGAWNLAFALPLLLAKFAFSSFNSYFSKRYRELVQKFRERQRVCQEAHEKELKAIKRRFSSFNRRRR